MLDKNGPDLLLEEGDSVSSVQASAQAGEERQEEKFHGWQKEVGWKMKRLSVPDAISHDS
jgi:hypothetical protein